ncbi:MAG TPA: ABC transporter substrate-binding protein, partial [Gammaproteobacteria bacterium]|nr:ABC transporter substrate-binding protein [Gammaproteobacteria bacterium]
MTRVPLAMEREERVSKRYTKTGKWVYALGLCLAWLCFLASGAAGAQTPDPAEQLGKILDDVLAELRDKSLDNATRRADIEKIVYENFDFRVMSQRALSTNWKKATEKEKQQFIDKFSKLLLATYIGRIEAYTDERVEVLGARVKGSRAEVST